jgi:quercetin dioxygenase-like cupin family protein
MLFEVTFDSEVVVSEHTHQQDKTGYLISGRMRLDVGEESRELSPSDAWLTPAGVPHKALTLEPCVIVEAFLPPHEEWR